MRVLLFLICFLIFSGCQVGDPCSMCDSEYQTCNTAKNKCELSKDVIVYNGDREKFVIGDDSKILYLKLFGIACLMFGLGYAAGKRHRGT